MQRITILFLLLSVLSLYAFAEKIVTVTVTTSPTQVSATGSAAAAATSSAVDLNCEDGGADCTANTTDPNVAGASGEGSSFGSSNGRQSNGFIIGLSVGLGVPVVIVLTLLVLWFVAKKRQWEVRNSIRRASRRLTGKFAESRSRRQSRQAGVRMASPPHSATRPRAGTGPRVDEKDLEKGAPTPPPKTTPGKTTTTIPSFDVDSPRTEATWKGKWGAFGGKNAGK